MAACEAAWSQARRRGGNHVTLAAIRFEAVGQDSPMTQVSFARTPRLVATSLDVCLTCQQDNQFVDQSVDYAVGGQSYPVYNSAPIEYASQSIGAGGAAGGSCGCSGSTSGFQSGGSYGGGLRGGRFGGGGRLLMLGGLAGGITAIANDPPARSPNN